MSKDDIRNVDKVKMKNLSDDCGRRHSISCAFGDRSILHSASETRLPLRILARSMVSDTSNSPRALPPPPIDVKFIQMYVKKLRPEFRQNSDPTFNRRLRACQRSSETIGTNSGQSSSSLASSNDDVLSNTQHPPRQHEHMKSTVIIPKRGSGPLYPIRRSASGNDLKESVQKIEELSLDDGLFPNEPIVTCYRILESVFASGADVVSNPALLCRLKIDHVIDLRPRPRSACKTTPKSQVVPHSPVTPTEPSLICVCPDWRHKRRLVHLDMNESDSSMNLIENFKKMNSLITSARVRGEKSLIFDEDSRGMAPVAVIEYIMYYYRMSYSAARAFVSGIISDVDISQPIQRALLMWQDELGQNQDIDQQRSMTACSYHQSTHDSDDRSPPFLHKKFPAWT